MAKILPWHRRTATVENTSIVADRPDASLADPLVYHDSDACELGRAIPEDLRHEGTGNLDQCPECHNLD